MSATRHTPDPPSPTPGTSSTHSPTPGTGTTHGATKHTPTRRKTNHHASTDIATGCAATLAAIVALAIVTPHLANGENLDPHDWPTLLILLAGLAYLVHKANRRNNTP